MPWPAAVRAAFAVEGPGAPRSRRARAWAFVGAHAGSHRPARGRTLLTRACDLAQGFVVKEMHTALRLVCFLALACGACSGTAPAGLAAGTALKMCTLTATLHDLARHAVIVAKEAARRHAKVLANAALFEAAGLNCTGGSGNALQEACALQQLVEAAKAPLQKAHDNAVDAAATLHRGAGMATEYISVLASFAGGGSGSGKACLLSTQAITTTGSNPSIQDTLDAITDTHNGNAKTCSNLFKHKDGPEALSKLLARAKQLKSTEKLENHDGGSGYRANNANIGGAYAGSNTCPLLGHTSSNYAGINAANGHTATFGAHFTIKVSSGTAGQLDATHTAKYYQDEDSPKTIADIAEAIEDAAKHTGHVDENGACDGPMQEVCNGTQKITHILRAEMKEREASAARSARLAKYTDKKDTSHKSAIQQGTDTRQDASEQDGTTAASREEGKKAEASAPRANLAHTTRKGWVALAFAAAPPAAR
ncbi:hypothetical protein, conserved in T. vivax [Trypanosoma vivax Y486]|uniref:Uncharacterized protein n=1 Tax=Trypanosoma vivax (strain Y486) TaxID=1055687 RepID=F9WMA5_TRYVY|nr:hypothetical protein, conserved in T. vivax [Trypanosoma vivax Y486]|eukprot:CCD18658.1 hypothetical protein, conserved in T. vivax [Trypanosoma vivax Y486]